MPPLRPRDGAFARRRRPGEGAFDVAEHLAFHQLSRDRAAIDRDERPVAPRAQLMDRLGAELLAGPALAGDEDRGAALCRAFDHVVDRPHRQRGANEAAKSAVLGDVVRRGEAFEVPSLQRVSHRDQEAVRGERLDDEVVGTLAHRIDRDLDRAVRGHDDHRAGQAALLDRAQDLDAVDVGQFKIEKTRHRGSSRAARRAHAPPVSASINSTSSCPGSHDKGAGSTACPRPTAGALLSSCALRSPHRH